MKPKDWNEMSDKEKKQMAVALLNSQRGHYLISQALVRAIEVMSKEKYPETSNIQDMEMLLELFPIYRLIAAVQGLRLPDVGAGAAEE